MNTEAYLYKIFILAIGLLLSACTTVEDANEGLQSSYIGETADNFFIQHGPPSASHKLDSGKIMYIWAENPTYYTTGGHSNTTVNIVGDTAYATTNTTPTSTVTVQCQVRIVASTEGIIERIEAHGDTVGNWELSRCAEIFRIRDKS